MEKLNKLEIEPRGKTLIINVNPDSEPHLIAAGLMYRKEKEEVADCKNTAFIQIQTPGKLEYPKLNEREYRSKLELPGTDEIRDYNAVVISGSPFQAFPRIRESDGRLYIAKWKMELHKFIIKAHQENVPVLGFCFGGHEIAEAMGGKVEKMHTGKGEGVWEIGYSWIERSPGSVDDPIMNGLHDKFLAIQNHTDIISRLPEGAELLAENMYGVQGFRLGRMWGFEFHPEKTSKDMEDYFAKQDKVRQKRIARYGKDPKEILKLGKSYSGEPAVIFQNFLKETWRGVQ